MSKPLPRVLLVDDDARSVASLARWLEVRGPLDVTTCTSPNQALTMLDAHEFDLLVCDMRMPGISGAQLMDVAAERWPRMRRAVLTGALEWPGQAEAVLLKGNDPESNGNVLIAMARNPRG